jgi:hypothetical protein
VREFLTKQKSLSTYFLLRNLLKNNDFGGPTPAADSEKEGQNGHFKG